LNTVLSRAKWFATSLWQNAGRYPSPWNLTTARPPDLSPGAASRRTAPACSLAVAFALALALCPLAQAGPIVDRIKSSGVIRCGGVPRPGLVNPSPDGAPSGLYLDLCRAIGAALLGGEGRIEFHPYDSDARSRASRAPPTIFSSSTARTSPTIASPAPRRSDQRSISSPPRRWSTATQPSIN
jgi:hypothetical protein